MSLFIIALSLVRPVTRQGCFVSSNHHIYRFWKQIAFKICYSETNRVSLQADEDAIVYSTPTPPAMAQKRICFCTYFLQQQSVEGRLFLANVGRVCLVLSDIEFYLLFQRLAGCGG